MSPKTTYHRSEITRENIRKTALQLFSEKGFSKVTIHMICDACGVATGLFHYYFSSKEALIEESKKMGEPMFENLLNTSELPDDIEEYIRKYFELYSQINIQLGTDIFMRVTAEKSSNTPVEMNRPTHIRLENKIAQAQNNGSFKNDYPASKIVQQLFVYSRGIIIDWCLS